MERHKITALLITALLALASCAYDKAESEADVSKRLFNSWLITNELTHIQPTDVGIYILEDSIGSGDCIYDSTYFFVKYVKTTLDGTISDNNYEDVAHQLGTWTKTKRFTPKVWHTQGIGVGLRDMVIGADIVAGGTGTNGMRIGGRRQAIIVPWVKDPESGDELSSSSPVYIYDIMVTGSTPDIIEYQADSLENFKKHYRGGRYADLDSTYYGYYVKQYPTQEEENDTIAIGTSVSLWYIGRYLDGVVFDTNIKDSAKYYRIYDESKSYTTLSSTYYRDTSEVRSNNSTVRGFCYALSGMKKYGDHCTTFFTSDFGYGASGKGDIPGYEPLLFDIWIKEQ